VPIVGTHLIVYTPEAEALRATLRESLGFDHVEAYDPPNGWQIFALPPAELGVHPSDGATGHQICFMCDRLEPTIEELRAKGVDVRGTPTDEPWGSWVTLVLPGDVEVLLYEAKHASPLRV
jgi:hypothetical protein